MHAPRPDPGAADPQFEFCLDHESPLLTVEEVAREWGYTEAHIRNQIEAGDLFAFSVSADPEKRPYYRILRATADRATRLTDAGRLEQIHTVDLWLYHPIQIGRKQILNVRDVLATLRISARHVRELYDQNELRGADRGLGQKEISLRIPRSQLTAFVQRRLQLNHQS